LVLQFLPGNELGHPARRDLDEGAGLGIAAVPGPSTRRLERAKPHEGDLVALAQRLRDVVQERVDRSQRIGLGETRVAGQPLDQLGLVHGASRRLYGLISNTTSATFSVLATLSATTSLAVYCPASYFDRGMGPTLLPATGRSMGTPCDVATGVVPFRRLKVARPDGAPVAASGLRS